jgi:hypothetical protein
MIKKFKKNLSIQQICGVVDGTHLPLFHRPDKRIINVANDYYKHEHIVNIEL